MNTIRASKRRRAGAGRGFTLIEIMIVIGIIVILATIGIAIGVGVKRAASERATKATLDTLDQAMSTFLKANPEPPGGATAYVTALASFTDTATTLNHLTTSGTAPNRVVLDGYGNPIIYIAVKSPTTLPTNWTPKPMGVFWSYGSNGPPSSGTSSGTDIFSAGVP